MKYALLLTSILFSSVAFSQTTASNAQKEENYEYMPRINDTRITGSIKKKLVGYKNGNPVNFIVVKNRTITVWDVALFDKLKVGEKVNLEGLVPLTWKPDFSSTIDAPSKSVVAKNNNK